MKNIMAHNDLVYPVTSFALTRDFNGYGLMTIGELAEEVYTGDLTYHDNILKPYWTLELDAVLVGGKDIGLCTGDDAPCGVVIDTGSSYNAMPTKSLAFLFHYLDSTGVTCQNYNDYPSITYVINGVSYTLEPSEYLTIIGEGFSSMYDSTVDSDQIVDCYMNVYTLNMKLKGLTLWLLGDVFISKYYTVFDFETQQVAFGERSW
jgi:hypothetical protein